MLKDKWLLIILLLGFLLRVININFPSFTADEARVAYRGFTLISTGQDELGRSFPIIFNSMEDYKLPLVSYITALSELVFGKNDFGARFIFIIIGSLIPILAYKIAEFFNKDQKFKVTVALLTAFSPPLIFLSKTPNEYIPLLFLITLLIYEQLFLKNKIAIILLVLLILLTSFWGIVLALLLITFFGFYFTEYKKNLPFYGVAYSLILVISFYYLKLPQSKLSLISEMSLFSSLTISNGINQVRGEGLLSGWPAPFQRVLFNKLFVSLVGLVNFFSAFSPSYFFSRFSETALFGFTTLGLWPKITLIPAILGVYLLLKKSKKIDLLIVGLLISCSIPVILSYPINITLIVLMIPFLAIIIARGVRFLPQWSLPIIGLAFFAELLVNISNTGFEIKKSNEIRPGWIARVTQDIDQDSKSYQVVILDNITSDMVTFIEWNNKSLYNSYYKGGMPYKYSQSELPNIKVVNDDFRTFCQFNNPQIYYLSKSYFERIKEVKNLEVLNVYQDSLNQDAVYRVANLCLTLFPKNI
jgi:hypothetical protein